ncbi:hypothetical protein MMC07_004733 [Pseudocyphellaria aurata]|nr:hypothetical protein [Pseudocyphellaria aurata]
MSSKTRFVCVSDTHNASPANGAFKLPAGDVLIHAGDLTNQGTLAEIRKTLDWIEAADFEVKIVIAGNHDITLDEDFYAEYGLRFHNQYPQDSQACIDLFKDYPSIIYLNHESAVIRLTKKGEQQATFKVFGSPFSPANGLWAFGYLPEEAVKLWEQIPLDADVVVTHTPPKYHCDESRGRGAAGCESLRRALSQVRPRLAICGHVHEGRGAERVRWDLESPHVQFKELDTKYWVDPGLNNKKQSLLDLTIKAAFPLENNNKNNFEARNLHLQTNSNELSQNKPGVWRAKDVPAQPPSQPEPNHQNSAPSALQEISTSSTAHHDTLRSRHISRYFPCFSSKIRSPAIIDDPNLPSFNLNTHYTATSVPKSPTEGWRMGRKETCVINAAIMGSSSRHADSGSGSGQTAKGFNKAIVVDIDLPVSVIE